MSAKHAASTKHGTGKKSAPEDVTHTKVLLAEDDESFIDALVIGLSREGFDITVARDGNQALKLFDEVDPDRTLSEPDRLKRARNAQKAQLERIRLAASKSRRRGAGGGANG